MKRMLSILLAAMLLCVAMAPLATAGAEQEPVTLRVTWWGSQTRHDLTMAAIEKFEEKYPYITVEAEFTSWDGYWSKLATQVAGGLMPDVIQMDYQYLNQYAQSGVLADLTPFFESGAIDVSNVAQSVIDSGAVNGTVYALSTGTNALATSAMLKAGAARGATGEHAIVYNAQRAHLILGPMGIVLCDALMGEITERMACAIGRSPAHKVLIPVSRCQVTVAGCERLPATEAVALAAREAARRIREGQHQDEKT